MEAVKRVFITGSNRGLGLQLVKLINKEHSEIEIHISSRSKPEQLAHQWQQHIPNHKLKCYQIDLNSHDSVSSTVSTLKNQNILFDYIIANAAVGCDYGQTMPSQQVATSTLITNVNSTIDFVKQFIPLLNLTGRVIIVSSFLGALNVHNQAFQKLVTNPQITEQQILNLSHQYIQSSKKQDMGFFHWSAYRTSKVLINAWNRFILPTYLKQGQTSIALHPGWCSTDMGGKSAPLTPLQGATRIYNTMWIKEVPQDLFYNNKFCSYETCQ